MVEIYYGPPTLKLSGPFLFTLPLSLYPLSLSLSICLSPPAYLSQMRSHGDVPLLLENNIKADCVRQEVSDYLAAGYFSVSCQLNSTKVHDR